MINILSWDVGIKNLSFCLLEKRNDAELKFNITEWGTIDITQGKDFKKISPEEIRLNLINAISPILSKCPQDTRVVIENQPVLKNPVMKSISCCIFDFFLIRGKLDQQKISEVLFTSPVNKLRLGILSKDQICKLPGKTTYARNKQIAVLSCEQLITGRKGSLTFYNNKKKDDLADSFLLAYHYLTKNFTWTESTPSSSSSSPYSSLPLVSQDSVHPQTENIHLSQEESSKHGNQEQLKGQISQNGKKAGKKNIRTINM